MAGWLAKRLEACQRTDERKKRANDLSLEFLLGLHDAQQGRCALSGVRMSHKRDDLFAASIDRTVSGAAGHTKGNVKLVCRAINLAKRELSDDAMRAFIRAIVAVARERGE